MHLIRFMSTSVDTLIEPPQFITTRNNLFYLYLGTKEGPVDSEIKTSLLFTALGLYRRTGLLCEYSAHV